MQSLIILIFPIKSLITLSSFILCSFSSLYICYYNSDLYRQISVRLIFWVIPANSRVPVIVLTSFLLCLLYISQFSKMCARVSSTPHLWQFSCCSSISFLMCRVSLEPSHPILILNMYLISLTLCLFNLMYIYVLGWYFWPPNSQKSFSVGNSFYIYVLLRAFLIISLFSAFFT